MENGTVKEAIKGLDGVDEVLRHRIRLNLGIGEGGVCQEARELIQKAITILTEYEKS